MITVINPNNLPTVVIEDLIPVQGELKYLSKENYTKLKTSIVENGFYIPMFIWEDPRDESKYIIDGHGRQKVMMGEGWGDTKVPYIKIEAADYDAARARLLEVTSQYGTITEDGYNDFIVGLEHIDISNIHFDALDYSFAPEAFVEHNPEQDEELASMVDEKTKTYSIKIKSESQQDIDKINIEIQDILSQYDGVTTSVK